MADYQVLGASELTADGLPVEPMLVEPLTHRGELFWLARYPALPGYVGGGQTPTEAVSRLTSAVQGKMLYRVSIPRYSAKAHAAWVERQLKLQAAAAEMEGVRESFWTAEIAKRHSVRKQDVHSADRKRTALLKEANVREPEVMRHLERATTAPGNVAVARWLLENLRPDEVECRWAREKFPTGEA